MAKQDLGKPRSRTWGCVLEEWKDWMQDLGENCERSVSLDIKSEGLSKKVIQTLQVFWSSSVFITTAKAGHCVLCKEENWLCYGVLS